MKRIRVDFNRLLKGGMVRSNVRRADGLVSVGERVLAVDPDEDMSYDAVVHSIDEATGAVVLNVNWARTWATASTFVVTGGA